MAVRQKARQHVKYISSKQTKISTRIGFTKLRDFYVDFVNLVQRTKQTKNPHYHILPFPNKTAPHSSGETQNGAPRWCRRWRRFARDSPFRSVSLRGIARQGDCWVQDEVRLRREGLWRRCGGQRSVPWCLLGKCAIFVSERFWDPMFAQAIRLTFPVVFFCLSVFVRLPGFWRTADFVARTVIGGS